MKWNPLLHGDVSLPWVEFLIIDIELFPTCTCRQKWTHVPFASCSAIPSFIVGVWEKQLLNFATSSLSISSSQDRITCLTAPLDFLKSSVLKPLLLAQQAWLTSSIQSSKACLLVPSKNFSEVNIESFALSLLALVSSWNASCWFLWLAAIISSDLDWIFASSINVALRYWPWMDCRVDWYGFA